MPQLSPQSWMLYILNMILLLIVMILFYEVSTKIKSSDTFKINDNMMWLW
uniref:ATP synthase F0 subunit 8 n=1 Tax=Otiothops birabeni TaxID=489295 RepID=H2E3M3_9ARAC|nr:ATP synthase F0 subunit 8 [Otiothops birabeni]